MAMSPRIPAAPTRNVAIATDARRGEVYLEVFNRHSLQSLGGPQCLTLADGAKKLAREPIVIAGSGAAELAAAAVHEGIDATAILPDLLPDALDMLFPACELPIVDVVAPLYLRPPDAKPPAPSPFAGARV